MANGYGKNKKIARMMAIERLVADLVQTQLIKLGLKDKHFLSDHTDLILKQSKETKEEKVLREV